VTGKYKLIKNNSNPWQFIIIVLRLYKINE
jgi:hypothetical protein